MTEISKADATLQDLATRLMPAARRLEDRADDPLTEDRVRERVAEFRARVWQQAMRTRANSVAGIIAKLSVYYSPGEITTLNCRQFHGGRFDHLEPEWMHSIWHDLKRLAEREATP